MAQQARQAVASPPRHAVIVAHPDTDSFALSVARTYCDAVAACGQTAVLRDLYRLEFDPVLKASERLPADPFIPAPDVAGELDVIAGSGAFVLIYPLWFGTPPAILKGYVERVLGAGFSHQTSVRHRHRPSHPLLGGRHLLSFSSSGSTEKWVADQGVYQALSTIFDGYLARAFWMDTPEHIHFGSIGEGLTESDASAHLAEVRRQAASMCDRLGLKSRQG